MKHCMLVVFAIVVAVVSAPAAAQAQPTVLKGQCRSQSQFGTGSADANLDEHSTPFRCDTAVITFPRSGRILLHFFLKADRRANMIGFAGDVIEDGDVEVDHLYLNDGRTLEVTKGYCQSWWNATGGIKSLVCGARLERGDLAVGAVVSFDASPPIRPRKKR